MPIAVLRPYCTMASRVVASDALRLATAVGVGTGSARNGDDIVRSWRQAAASLIVHQPRTIKDLAGRAAGIGIGVRRAPRPDR